ncbi:ROK family transcriptional regulator [Actinomycetes bacterium KLBMP 9759]
MSGGLAVPAGQQTVRRHNRALVLGYVAEAEPVSRARVAEHTGLTRGTVSSLVDELISAGLLTELSAVRGGTGRPASPLQLNRAGPAGLGLEIGVEHVGASVVDLSGTVRASRRVASDHRDRPSDVGLGAAARLASDVVAEAGLPVAGACVALPGLVDAAGVLRRAPNLPHWNDVDAADRLAGLLGTPVRAGNEADLAALAELWFGDVPADFVHVSADVGIGAGIVLGGALFRGPGGCAGELGHVVVEPGGPACSCGGAGCLERVAGLDALLRVAGTSDVEGLVERPGSALAVAAGSLRIALGAAVSLLDVRTVVLGGVYARLGERLRRAVAAELATMTPPVEVRIADPATGGALRAAAASVVRSLISSGSA